MLKLWKWYQNCLALHPLKTQVISSGLIWGVGDIAAQAITHSTAKNQNRIEDDDKEFKINWKRVATTSLFGFGFVGPVGHYWYEGLDRYIRLRLMLKPNSFRFVATKVAVDAFLFGPLDLLVFFTYMGFSTGKSVPQIKEDVKRDFLPAFILEGAIWPIVQVANFRFIPVRYQLLYVNFFCLSDSCFLSWIEQQEDAPWKQWVKSFIPGSFVVEAGLNGTRKQLHRQSFLPSHLHCNFSATQSTRLTFFEDSITMMGRRPVISSIRKTPSEYTSDLSVNLPLGTYSGARYQSSFLRRRRPERGNQKFPRKL